MTHAGYDFELWFAIDSDEKPEMNGEYGLGFKHSTNEAEFYKLLEDEETRINTSSDFQEKLQELKPEDFELIDWESTNADTFTESWDFGMPYYDHERGYADWEDNWHDVEIDSITREYYNKWTDDWEEGEEKPETAIQKFFGMGYKNPRQFED